MRQICHWAFGLSAMLACAMPVNAGEFIDPLDRPAVLSENAFNSRLLGVDTNGETLIAVGPSGHILTSETPGGDWTQSTVPLSSDLVAVRFVDRDNAWAVGHDGVILHSQDAGRTWEKKLDGFQVIEIIEKELAQLGEATDEPAEFRRAELQRFVADGAAKPFFDIAFISEHEGFAVGPFNLAVHTSDGGNTWQLISDRTENPEGNHLHALTTVSDTLWMVGERGLVRYWDASVKHFKAVSTPYEGSFFGLVGAADNLLAFGMRGQAVMSSDGGRTWGLASTGARGSITNGAKLRDGRFVLATLAGELLISSTDFSVFERQEVSVSMPYFSVIEAGGSSVALAGELGVRVEPIL